MRPVPWQPFTADAMTLFRALTARVLARLGPAQASRWRRSGRTLILTYHNIVASPGDAGADAPLHLSRDAFARQLEYLRRRFDVIPLHDSLSAAPRGSRPRIAITFDDAYRGAVSHGVRLLAEANLPATIFVTPGRLGGDAFWWDSFAGSRDASIGFRAHVLNRLAGDDASAHACASEFGMTPAPVPADSRTATERELREAVSAHPALTLGAHTWTHPNLAGVDADILRDELQRPRSWFIENGYASRTIEWLSYPYGLKSPAVAAAAREAGYQAAVSTEGGWMIRPRDVYAVPRLTIPGDVTADGFILRTAGLRQ